ncbi:MAG: universal stress protein [Candidatus Methanomethylophilaceae archaeon]|nr:universal stress protein [Candidatus Methanomethylophilaceae archaeon]
MTMDEDKMFLLCTDGSENSYRAAEYLASMASCLRGRIALLHVVKKEEAVAMGEDIKDPGSGITGKRLNPAIEILQSRKLDYTVSVQIGDPEKVILEMSSKYEAIVMGYKGVNERRIAEMLLGSVADHVLRHTKKPVILVP